jgi:lipopolysaccharide export system protein LptA
MISIIKHLKLILTIIYLLIIVSLIVSGGSQIRSSRLELLHADVSKGIVENGSKFRILEGNVHARQDTLELFCNRAIYSEEQKVITLRGNVKLLKGRDTLIAEEVRYFEARKIAIAEREVHVFRTEQEMRCQYLEYHYQTDMIKASGNLFLHEKKNRVYVTGLRGEYSPKSYSSFVQNNAHLWRLDSTSRDTLHIFSDRMEYHFGNERRAVARNNVHIQQGNLHANCDSAIYLVEKDIIMLEGKPKAVQENNEMYGKHIKLFLKDRELERINVEGGAQAISFADSLLEKENRLEGKQIIMYINNRKLIKLYAISNARSYYHLEEDEEDKGINVASADTIKAYFINNEIDSISVIGGAQGIYYPEGYKGPILQE